MKVLRRKHQNNLHTRDKEEKTKNPRWLPWKQVKSDSWFQQHLPRTTYAAYIAGTKYNLFHSSYLFNVRLIQYTSQPMQSLFKILIFGLMFCLMAEPAVCAENDKKKPGSILRFLQANRAKREIMLATGKIDKDAKVYYLYEIDRLYDEDDLVEYVDFMAPALRAIFKKGANLIMYTNKYISGSNSRERHNDLADELRLIRKIAVKCPIINTYRESTSW